MPLLRLSLSEKQVEKAPTTAELCLTIAHLNMAVVVTSKYCQTYHPCLDSYLYKLLRDVCPNVVPWQGGYVAPVPAQLHFTGTLLQQGEHWTNQSSVFHCFDQSGLSIALSWPIRIQNPVFQCIDKSEFSITQWTNHRSVLKAGSPCLFQLSSFFLFSSKIFHMLYKP